MPLTALRDTPGDSAAPAPLASGACSMEAARAALTLRSFSCRPAHLLSPPLLSSPLLSSPLLSSPLLSSPLLSSPLLSSPLPLLSSASALPLLASPLPLLTSPLLLLPSASPLLASPLLLLPSASPLLASPLLSSLIPHLVFGLRPYLHPIGEHRDRRQSFRKNSAVSGAGAASAVAAPDLLAPTPQVVSQRLRALQLQVGDYVDGLR
eukprot:762670-Hanusia_phi.AAC.1